MAAVMKQCQRGREDRRKDKQRKHSHSRNKPKKSVCWCLTFFLLFVLPGAASLTLTGQKDSSITLPCNSSNTEELSTLLTFGSKIAYGSGQDKHFTGRVNESGSCDLILHDLKTTDAGKYMSKVFANGQLLDRYTYDIRVDVNLTGRKDEELMFDELPHEAENVEHFTNPDWTKVWRRRQGVLTDRLTDKNDRLTIKNFSSSDAGIYRVLNSSGGILVTVTVTESGSESKDKLDSAHELDGTEKNYIVIWVLLVVVVVMVVVIAFAVIIIKSRCQNRSNEHDSYQGVSTQETVQGPRSPNNTSGCLVGLH